MGTRKVGLAGVSSQRAMESNEAPSRWPDVKTGGSAVRGSSGRTHPGWLESLVSAFGLLSLGLLLRSCVFFELDDLDLGRTGGFDEKALLVGSD
jgi:hypothetical protein